MSREALVRGRPIFVVGFQRSGTTLLQSILGAHSRIAAPPELHFVSRFVQFGEHWGPLEEDRRVRRVIHELLNPPVPLLADIDWDEEAVTSRALAGDRTWGGILRATLDWFAEQHGAHRWSEKTPLQTPRQVLSLIPDAQLVHIVREPSEAVASSLAAPWNILDVTQNARAWVAFNRAAAHTGDELPASTYLRVRFEDLVTDSVSEVTRICEHLGEMFESTMLEQRHDSASVPSAAAWQSAARGTVQPRSVTRTLSAADRWRVHAVADSLAEQFGYETAGRPTRLAGRFLNLIPSRERLAEWQRQRRARRATTATERQELFEQHLGTVAAKVKRDDRQAS